MFNNSHTLDSLIQPFCSSYKHMKHFSITPNNKFHQPFRNKLQNYFSNNDLTNSEKTAFYNSINNNINKHLFNINIGENELRFASSSVSKERKHNNLNLHYAIDAKSKPKKKKNKSKKHNNHVESIFGIENVPQNRYYIDKERKKREKQSRFNGLIVINKINQNKIIELHNENIPKLKLQMNLIQNNINNTKCLYTRNKYQYNDGNINNSVINIKLKNLIPHDVLEEQTKKLETALRNHYTITDKTILTCNNEIRSQNNCIIPRINKEGISLRNNNNLKLIVDNTKNTKDEINIQRTKSFELKNSKSNDKVIHINNDEINNRKDILKHSISYNNYSQHPTPKTKNEINNNNNNFKSSNSHHKTHYNQVNLKSFKPKTKQKFSMTQSNKLNQSPSSNVLSSPNKSPEPQSNIQSKKQTINFKDFKSLLYIIVPGNASYLVKHCMLHRINWKETFSSSSSLFNFKWQQLSHGIDFNGLSHIPYVRQMVNHYEYHTLISHKANMFANLFKWCEDRGISVFKYVPFTIVHKILKEDKDNLNKQKQERLEEFITSNIERYVKRYEQIGVIQSYDPVETYADIFPWLQPSNKKTESEKAYEEGNKNKKQQINKDMILGKKTRIEIPSTHWTGKNMWLIKATNLNRGQCIRLVDSYQKMEKIIKMIQEGVEKDFTVREIEENENKGVDDNNKHAKENEKKKYSANKIIIQKYIESPLLYQGRKCDIRLWVLITHKMKVYMFKEGHFKTCSVNYNINSQDAFTHITNYSFQKYSDNFAKFEIGNEVPFYDFQKFIDEAYPKRHYSIKENFMSQAKEIVDVTMKCAKAQINLNKRKYSFEIFGYDFMLDSDFNLFLIEINTNPGLEESSPWIKKIVPRMIDDALRLTIDVLFNTKYDHTLNYKKQNVKVNKDDESSGKEMENNEKVPDNKIIEQKEENKKYISPFPVPGYSDDDNLWDFVCDLNEKDEYELKLEEIEKEKQLKKEKDKEAFYTGIKHLMQKRNTRK